MHNLNNADTIGKDLFTPPNNIRGIRAEVIYNKLFGGLPTILSYSEEFEVSCLPVIEKHFDRFAANLNYLGDKRLEESIWVGKPDTEYSRIVLELAFKNETLEGNKLSVRLDSPLSFSSSVFANDLSAADLSSNVYVGVGVAAPDIEGTELVNMLLRNHKIEKKSNMYIMTNNYGELDFTALPLDIPKINLDLNYGKVFGEFHQKMVDSLNNKKSGLYLLHGAPGTGKSSYIKYLLNGEIKRKIVYIPIGMIDRLVSPDILPLLMSNKDLIMVMEDAEKALITREDGSNLDSNLVSAILNLTDGFIGQAMNISIIATFNTDKEKIDPALLRKGRLKLCHEFGKLNLESAKSLAKSLNLDESKITESMTLADIYHLEEQNQYSQPEKKVMGFGAV